MTDGGGRSATVCFLLDDDHASAVRALRERLGVPEPPVTTWPHVSLSVVLGQVDGAALEEVVATVSGRVEPFTVRARDFGVFEDHKRGLVLHVPVVRTAALAQVNEELDRALDAAGLALEGHYRPWSWFPHVTLWSHTLTPAALSVAVRQLAESPPLAWTLSLRELTHLRRSPVAGGAR